MAAHGLRLEHAEHWTHSNKTIFTENKIIKKKTFYSHVKRLPLCERFFFLHFVFIFSLFNSSCVLNCICCWCLNDYVENVHAEKHVRIEINGSYRLVVPYFQRFVDQTINGRCNERSICAKSPIERTCLRGFFSFYLHRDALDICCY